MRLINPFVMNHRRFCISSPLVIRYIALRFETIEISPRARGVSITTAEKRVCDGKSKQISNQSHQAFKNSIQIHTKNLIQQSLKNCIWIRKTRGHVKLTFMAIAGVPTVARSFYNGPNSKFTGGGTANARSTRNFTFIKNENNWTQCMKFISSPNSQLGKE